MDDDLIREHIARLAQPNERLQRELIARVSGRCWPGGSADRTEPVALHWLRRWQPSKATWPLPTCSCAAGHCALCN